MPTANDANLLGECLGLCSDAGQGKTTFWLQAPQPHAVFCLDKAAIGKLPPEFPGYDKKLTFHTPYLPPDVDITKDVVACDRSVFDKIRNDIMDIRNALHAGKPEFELRSEKETWLLPKTVVFEGGDFIRNRLVDHYLARHGKHDMSEFERETLIRWGAIGKETFTLLCDLVKLPALRPVNVVVTMGWDAETKQGKDERGKMTLDKTGYFTPDFGGKLDTQGPRLFKDFWMPVQTAGKFFMATNQAAPYDKYKGIRSGRFGLKPVEDVTLVKPYVNQWNRLFNINP